MVKETLKQQQSIPSVTSTKVRKRKRQNFFDTKCTVRKCIIYSTLHPFLNGRENHSLVFTGGRERKQCTEKKKKLRLRGPRPNIPNFKILGQRSSLAGSNGQGNIYILKIFLCDCCGWISSCNLGR